MLCSRTEHPTNIMPTQVSLCMRIVSPDLSAVTGLTRYSPYIKRLSSSVLLVCACTIFETVLWSRLSFRFLAKTNRPNRRRQAGSCCRWSRYVLSALDPANGVISSWCAFIHFPLLAWIDKPRWSIGLWFRPVHDSKLHRQLLFQSTNACSCSPL